MKSFKQRKEVPLRNRNHRHRMGLIPKQIRNQAKAAIAKLTDTKFLGMVLAIERKKDRFIARTTPGNLFGFIYSEGP